MIKERNLIGLAIIAVLAACGGGGGGGSSVPPAGGGSVIATPTPGAGGSPVPAGDAVANVSISMPKGTYAASERRAQTIGTGTESIVFTLLQQNGTRATGTPQTFGLTQSSADCTLNTTTQALNCTLPVNAPIGTDVFLAQTYDGPNGTGNLTGSGAVALSVGTNQSNSATIVLNAQVASVVVAAGDSFLGLVEPSGNARRAGMQALRRPAVAVNPVTSTRIFVIAVDSAGNTILNPSSYSAPIYLQIAFDAYGESTSTADVTLTATYAAGDPSPCTAGGTATASTWYASLPVCSPSDTITASLSPYGGTDPSNDAYVFGWISAASLFPTPAPASTPMPLPTFPSANSYADIYVNWTGPTGSLPVNPQ